MVSYSSGGLNRGEGAKSRTYGTLYQYIANRPYENIEIKTFKPGMTYERLLIQLQ